MQCRFGKIIFTDKGKGCDYFNVIIARSFLVHFFERPLYIVVYAEKRIHICLLDKN